jgi:Zn finger protein HypA/HybF involved in hydrogenase expression
MKRLFSALFCIAGAVLFLLGLLFLVGAAGQGSRYAIALAGLVSGAVLLGFGIRWFRAADADSPEQVLADLLEAARKRNGEITDLDIGAALGRRAPLAAPVLEKLVAEKLCERRERDGARYYVLPDLQPRLFVRKCRFCGAESSIASQATKCPRCGGDVASAVERHAVSDGAYKMDD